MKIFKTKKELNSHIATLKKSNKSIGFVPTMGALHQGHLSLIKKAKSTTDIVVVSIFVNPTQFDNKEDLDKYPKTLSNDLNLLEGGVCDIVYAPNAIDIYDGNIICDEFNFDGLENQMEGKFRQGHFNGVGTIVKKLFEIVRPNKAFFGEKDFQQLQIIKKLVEKEKLPIEIIGCPIFRTEEGLAMSSRNTRLTKEHRKIAPFIYKTLKEARDKFKNTTATEVINWVEGQFKDNKLLKLEYFFIGNEKTLLKIDKKENNASYRGFIVVYAGDIRLIDTISL